MYSTTSELILNLLKEKGKVIQKDIYTKYGIGDSSKVSRVVKKLIDLGVVKRLLIKLNNNNYSYLLIYTPSYLEIHEKYSLIYGEELIKLGICDNISEINTLVTKFSKALKLTKPTEERAKSLVRNYISEIGCTMYTPKTIAAAAIYIACKTSKNTQDIRSQNEISEVAGCTSASIRRIYPKILKTCGIEWGY
jgi:DNA-binding Lrp family transcriptional regulator